MPSGVASPAQAVIICTRNRPDDLRRTLQSIAASEMHSRMLVLIVDGSDQDQSRHTQQLTAQIEALDVQYLRFRGAPAGTRQRNYGIDHLPSSVKIVHFIDDDVVVLPGYFSRLANVLSLHPEVGGVGGLIIDARTPDSEPRLQPIESLFLLSSARPGKVLLSGHASPVSFQEQLVPVEWLSTCASTYRRTVFDRYRFDPTVEGPSPRLEDLDFSYRVGQSWKLLADPRAQLIHYPSSTNRRSVRTFTAESLPRRYWFVEKNIRHPLRKPAFWWATVGKMLAVLTSSKPQKGDALRGLLQGIRDVWHRNHPLLQSSER